MGQVATRWQQGRQASLKGTNKAVRRAFLKTGAAALVSALICLETAGADETVFSLDIPAAPATEALDRLAEITGHSLFYPAGELESAVTSALDGSFTLQEALDALLKGTRLNAVVTERGVIVVSMTPDTRQVDENEESNVKKELSLLSRVTLLLLGAAGMQGVAAQEPEAGGEDQVLEEVVVTGTRGSIINSLNRKKGASNVVDSIEAEDLGKFPDINLAEALQRVPGVALERSVTGSGRTLTVRGLSSQFTRVEINGMGGATGGGGRSTRIDTATRTAGQDGRNFNFDILPTELFSSAVVAKSPQAADTEGGIAALVKLNSPAPFDLEETAGTASVQGNWGEEGNLEPRISGLFSRQFSEQFALLLGGVYSKNDSRTYQVGFDRLVTLGSATNDPAGAAPGQLEALIPRGAAYIVRQRDTENLSGILTAQWRPSDAVDLRFDALVTDSDGTEAEAENFIDLTRNVPAPTSLTVADGVGLSGSFDGFRRIQAQFRHDGVDDQLQQYTLQGTFDVTDIWSVMPFVGYNEREVTRPFNEVNYFASGANDSVTYSITGKVDDFSTSLTDFSGNPQDFILGNVLRAQNESKSDELDFKLDIAGEFDSIVKTFKAGVSYRERRSEVDEPFRGALNFNPAGPPLADLVDLHGFGFGGNAPDSVFGLDVPDAVAALLAGQDLLDPGFDISVTQAAGIVIGNENGDRLAAAKVSEDILAGYAEIELEYNRFRVNAGVRVVETDQSSSGAQSVDGTVLDIEVSNKYTEALPSVNVRYEAVEDLFLRGTWSKALSRPSLQALSPRETINFNTLTGSRGNPQLDPFTVDQFDLGAEWYFHTEGLLGFTYFEKDFSSLIGQETVILQRNQASTGGGEILQAVEFNQPVNTGDGKVKGFEVTAQTSLFFVPGELKNAGVIFNYTDLDSRTNVETAAGSQTLPFPNLSPSSLNAAVYYDNGRFDTRLGYTWRKGFLQDGLDPDGSFFRQEDFGSLGLTMNLKWGSRLTFQLQANNLLDEELEYSSTSRKIKIRRLDLERRVIFGVRYAFL